MAFNNLKQLPENILLSKSYDMAKSRIWYRGGEMHYYAAFSAIFYSEQGRIDDPQPPCWLISKVWSYVTCW